MQLPDYLRKRLPRAVIAWLLLGLLMFITRPARLPVVLLVVPFAILYIASYNSMLTISSWRLHLKGTPVGQENRQSAAMISLFLVLLLVLDSLGQLTIRDVLTLVLIFVVAYFYLIRMRKES